MIIDHPATVHATPEAQLLLGDARSILATLPDASVDMICTSPPYYAARDYGTGHWEGGRADCSHPDAITSPSPGAAALTEPARPAARRGSTSSTGSNPP